MDNKIKFKTIPFDVKMAKKITDGIIPGEITTIGGYKVRIICGERKHKMAPIVALIDADRGYEEIWIYGNDGSSAYENTFKFDLQLKVPELFTYKEGDIITCVNYDGSWRWIGIFKDVRDNIYPNLHVIYFLSDANYKEVVFDSYTDNIGNTRLATEEEKQVLIEALKEDGCKNILKQFFGIEDSENVTESNQESENKFQPFDKVLVRDSKVERWHVEFFGYIIEDEEFKYRCCYDKYLYCIPYNEETKHMLGTTKDWEDKL